MQLLFGAFLSCTASLGYLAAQEAPSPHPGRQPVEIYVTASDKNSSSVSLNQPELTVTLDKQPVQVASVRSAKSDKLLFAVLVDASTSNRKQSDSVRAAANQFFEGLSAADNRGYLVFFDQSVRMSGRPLLPSEAREALAGLKFGGATAVFDAIAQTCTTVLSKRVNPEPPRRVILLISDGDDNMSHIYLEEAIQLAEKEGVSIFSLATPTAGNNGERVLSEFSKKTGGQVIINNNMEKGATDLLAAIDSQWVLSLVPPPFSDQNLHSLMVKSSRKDVHLSAPEKIVLQ